MIFLIRQKNQFSKLMMKLSNSSKTTETYKLPKKESTLPFWGDPMLARVHSSTLFLSNKFPLLVINLEQHEILFMYLFHNRGKH